MSDTPVSAEVTTRQLQRRVEDFVRDAQLEASVPFRSLDLVAEIGELSAVLLRRTAYGRTEFHPNGDWADEFGDVFFSLICLANLTGVNLDHAVERAIQKYKDRHDGGWRRTGTIEEH